MRWSKSSTLRTIEPLAPGNAPSWRPPGPAPGNTRVRTKVPASTDTTTPTTSAARPEGVRGPRGAGCREGSRALISSQRFGISRRARGSRRFLRLIIIVLQ